MHLETPSPGTAPSFFPPKLHPVVRRLLYSRFQSDEKIQAFLSNNLKELPPLTKLLDLEKAARRLIQAFDQKESIAIYGDYDVDGTTSCALLYHFFQMLGTEVAVIQPSRFIEGYGLHAPSVEEAHAKGIRVMITVDCGITSNLAADRAKEMGIDLIITDHHTDGAPTMPDAFAVVNPNRRDEPLDSPLRPMAGVGVAFCLALKVREIMLAERGLVIPSLYPLLQFVAIGTIADLAHLTPVNANLVRHGLRQIPRSQYPGILAFLAPDEKDKAFLPSERIAFGIGPLINAKGRVGHPELALKLLIAPNEGEAKLCLNYLQQANQERKFHQAEVWKEVREQILRTDWEKSNVQVVYSPKWHEGVVGIVASKIVESFQVPAIVLTDLAPEHQKDGGGKLIKGSARTAGDLNIFEQLKQCSHLFLKFGGHKAAAGLTLDHKNLEEFRSLLNENLGKIPEIMRRQNFGADAVVAFDEIGLELIRDLDILEPFGQGNSRPLFMMENLALDSFQVLKESHVKWVFKSRNSGGGEVSRGGFRNQKLSGISFNYFQHPTRPHPQEFFESPNPLKIQFRPSINVFQGKEFLQLLVEQIAH